KSVHTTFILRYTPCPDILLYDTLIPYSPKNQIPDPYSRSKITVSSSYQN
ncbi:Uncharacterized protein FWK35_00007850, partial [Aphis craccivora]